MTTTTSVRKSAEERREEILEAAMIEFAEKGLYGTSTDDIARRVGVSQPYLFRLYGTKKELYIAAVERCFENTLAMMRSAAGGKVGEDALHAIGEAYQNRLVTDPTSLRMQLNSYVACNDPDVCEVVRAGYGRLVEFVGQALRRRIFGRMIIKVDVGVISDFMPGLDHLPGDLRIAFDL